MISVLNCFDVFHKHIKKIKDKDQLLPFIELIVRGIEIDVLQNDQLKSHVIHIDCNGSLMLCKEFKYAHYKIIPFNNLESILNRDKYLMLKKITCSSNNYKEVIVVSTVGHASSSLCFSIKFLQRESVISLLPFFLSGP